jgi:hypothetical protein
VVELIDELLETEFHGVMSEQGSPCGHCLGLPSSSIFCMEKENLFTWKKTNRYASIEEY